MYATPIKQGIKMLHANYAVGVMDALRQMYPDDAILAVTGENAFKLLQRATFLQDKAQKLLLSVAPQLDFPSN